MTLIGSLQTPRRPFGDCRPGRGIRAIWPVFVLLVLVLVPVAFADTVYLDNPPERHSGTVTGVSERQIILRKPDGAAVVLPRARITHIEFGNAGAASSTAAFPLPDAPGAATQPQDTDGEAPGIRLSQSPGGAVPLPSQNPVVISSRQSLYPFQKPDGTIDTSVFTVLSRFRGARTGAAYAGLYNFVNKGTVWIRMPRVLEIGSELHFTLFGKHSGSPGAEENFQVRVRFLDDTGQLMGETSDISFAANPVNKTIEWFERLEGAAGLAGEVTTTLQIPPHTRTIEFRATTPTATERHLIGYLGRMRLVLPSRNFGHDERE